MSSDSGKNPLIDRRIQFEDGKPREASRAVTLGCKKLIRFRLRASHSDITATSSPILRTHQTRPVVFQGKVSSIYASPRRRPGGKNPAY